MNAGRSQAYSGHNSRSEAILPRFQDDTGLGHDSPISLSQAAKS